MSYVDVYTEAVVISICLNKSIDRKCFQRFRGNNKGEKRHNRIEPLLKDMTIGMN